MKDRNLDHSDNWETPPYFYDELNKKYSFDFDPCPINHDITKWNGLIIDWGKRNFINPPYSQKLKEKFVKKAIEESKKGKLCVLLLPVLTSTKLFHEIILPEKPEIAFIFKRIKFIGINTKGEKVNYNLKKGYKGTDYIVNSGMHDSMILVLKN